MKRFCFVFIFALLCFEISAQFNMGFKFGLNLNQDEISQNQITSLKFSEINPVAGLFLQFRSDKLIFMPEVLYSQKSGGFLYEKDNLTANYSVSYIDIPAMVGARFFIFNIHTGPVISFLFDQEITIKNADQTINESLNADVFNEMNFGWQAGLSLEIKKLVINARYEFGVGEMMREFTVPNSSIVMIPDERNSLFQVTLGYKFFDPK